MESGGPGEGAGSALAPALALIVLDGWALAPAGPGNAVSLARTPVFDELWSRYPHTELTTWGEAVGLPEGQMGNSEVGHLNLGAGAIVKQDLLRIDEAVRSGELASNPVLKEAMTVGEKSGAGGSGGSGGGPSASGRVHLIGLVSDGGVHSGFGHLKALIEMAAKLEVAELIVHAFTDGRDTLPTSGAGFLETVEGWLSAVGQGRIGSVVGRYWAMDRDRRWERIQRAYDLLVHGRAEHRAERASLGAREAYERGETDEFIEPMLVGSEDSRIRAEDSVIAFNFRPDRMREITRALAEPGFDEVDRGGAPPVSRYATMTEYEEGWPYPVAFPSAHLAVTLPRVVAERGLGQLHVAETEKYAHVTYFFNGGEEEACSGEERELVPSPREVPTYDHKPEMSAPEAAAAFASRWREKQPGFGIINFANADMVGHTGVIPAAVEAVETVDRCLGQVVEAVGSTGGACLITADHGNADQMLEPDGTPNTAHSMNPVPLILTVSGVGLRDGGILADVAPTALDVLGIEQPEEMTGRSLVVR